MRPATSRPTVLRLSRAALPASSRNGTAQNGERLDRHHRGHRTVRRVRTPPIPMAGPPKPRRRFSLLAPRVGVITALSVVASSTRWCRCSRFPPMTRPRFRHTTRKFRLLQATATPPGKSRRGLAWAAAPARHGWFGEQPVAARDAPAPLTGRCRGRDWTSRRSTRAGQWGLDLPVSRRFSDLSPGSAKPPRRSARATLSS